MQPVSSASMAPPRPMASALQGLQRSAAQAADAAQRIAAAGAPMPDAGSPAMAEAIAAAPDMARAAIDLLVAHRAYQANAVTMRAADAMQSALLRATG